MIGHPTILAALNKSLQEKFNINDVLFSCSMPVPYHAVKKNNRPIFTNKKTGRWFPGKSEGLKSMERHIESHILQKRINYDIMEPIDVPLWAVMHFYFPYDVFYTQKKKVNKKLPDLSNLLELPADSLTRAAIISDDTLIHSFDLSRRLPGSEYRLDIFLMRFSESQAVTPQI